MTRPRSIGARAPPLDRRDKALLARVGRASNTDPEAGFCPRVECEEKKIKKMKLLFLARAVVYLLAFLVPPLLVSFAGVRAAESDCYEAPPAAANGSSGTTTKVAAG
jgi:hypothetical protein